MTDQTPHPITLERILFTRSSVIAVPGHVQSEGKVTAGPENTIDVAKIDGQPGHFEATMRMVLNQAFEQTSPYSIDMECMALLTADNTLTAEEAIRGVMITAHSVLYGAIREAVLWLTGRQPYGPLFLGLSVLRSSPENTPTKD